MTKFKNNSSHDASAAVNRKYNNAVDSVWLHVEPCFTSTSVVIDVVRLSSLSRTVQQQLLTAAHSGKSWAPSLIAATLKKLKNRKILRHVLNGDNSFTSQWTHGSLFRMDISDNDLRKWIRSTSGQMNQSLVGSTCCLKAAAAPQQTNVFSHVTSGERTGVSAAGVSAGRIYRRVCVSAL